MSYHIVGIDPSISSTGVARIRPGEVVAVATVTSKPERGARYPETLNRLRGMCRRIIEEARRDMQEGDVLVVVIEAPIFGTVTDSEGKPIGSAGQAHTRAGLWWMLYHLLEKMALMVVVEPTKLKRYVTRKGNAPKDLVFATMIRNFPDVGIMDNNQADALGLASMAARELGFPMEPSVQRVDPGALEGVNWPDHITQRRIQNGKAQARD